MKVLLAKYLKTQVTAKTRFAIEGSRGPFTVIFQVKNGADALVICDSGEREPHVRDVDGAAAQLGSVHLLAASWLRPQMDVLSKDEIHFRPRPRAHLHEGARRLRAEAQEGIARSS